MRYRSKPVVIEAVQLRWSTWGELCEFLGDNCVMPASNSEEYSETCGEPGPQYIQLTIPTLEGNMIAKHGDYIIKGLKGEFYPCKPDIFRLKYERCEP